ncbi:MAG: tRNA-dihydrouridine synthase [bacterium]|nr:tRNA-dihydrouridine synthase [bacterium]
MSGVTDRTFRRMLLKYGRPDVFFTEFVPAAGLSSKGREKLLETLKFLPAEHPIVAQVFGANPDLFEKTAIMIRDLGFDGIDINMGCPNKDIEKQGAGAALIKNPDLAQQIIRETKRGAGKLPVSVKTRIGYAKNQISEWIPVLLKENLAALTVHFRTRNEIFKGSANWELAKKIVKLRDRYAPETLIFGNGDVESLAQARSLVKKTGLDGIMVGRGVFANPWFFSGRSPGLQERLDAIIEHAKTFEKLHKNFNIIKKYFKGYVNGFVGAKDLRDSLMGDESTAEIKKTIKDFLNKYPIPGKGARKAL